MLCFALTAGAQHQVQKLWESDTTLAIPESVLPDIEKGILYVSLIDGNPWDVDGKGGIAKLDLNGKILNANWVTGLNAPKGMGRFGNKLYVADVTEVAVIDIDKGKIESKIAVDSAMALNDITVDSKGIVYVSDSRKGIIHRIENGKAAVFLTGYNGVNGLRAVGNDVYVLTRKLQKADGNKTITTLSDFEQGGDGIEPVGNGDFITSAWGGYMYYVYADGRKDVLLDTHEQKINTADIGYDPVRKIIYIPTFFKKSVMAYQLK